MSRRLSFGRVSLTTVIGIACGLLVNQAFAQTSSAPSQTGWQPNRDYLALQPFEAIDTAAGNLILRFDDLVLHGNAGFDLRVERAYNAYTHSWGFGISGLPLRVFQNAIPANAVIDDTIEGNQRWTPTFLMADGEQVKTTFMQVPNAGDASTLQWVSSPQFWKYHRGGRTLYLPDGRIAVYDDLGRLASVHDPFANWLSFSYGTTSLLVSQSLSDTESRRVLFSMDFTTWLPTQMTYEDRVWTYEYEVPGRLRFVRQPAGGAWEFAYEGSGVGTLIGVVTPYGGKIAYTYDWRDFQTGPNPIENHEAVRVLTSRAVSGRELEGGTWVFEYGISQGVVSGMLVRLPSGVSVGYTYQYLGTAVLAGGWALVDISVRPPGQTAGAPIEQVSLDYDVTLRAARPDKAWVVPEVKVHRTTRGGRTYTVENFYSGDTTTFHQYHRPYRIVETGASGELSRTTEFTYQSVASLSSFIVGLITEERVTVGSQTVTRSWSYNTSNGFRAVETLYGITTNYTSQASDFGNVSTVTNNGHTTSYKYRFGQASETRTPEYTTNRDINPDGSVASETHGGRRTAYRYDALGRVVEVDPPGDQTLSTTTDYSAVTNVVTQRGTSVTVTTLDGFGRAVETSNAVGMHTHTRYDALGRTVFVSLPFDDTNQADPPGLRTCYDNLGRIIREEHILESAANAACGSVPVYRSRSYDDGGHTVTVRDEQGHTTVLTYRAFGHPDDGRLSRLVDAKGQAWGYEYDALGSLTRVTAPGGVTRTWEYADPMHPTLLTRETHPESGTVSYTDYYPSGLLWKKTDAKGVQFTYDYDGNNRPKKITAGGIDTTITYEVGTDNRWDVTYGGVTTHFRYDDSGRLAARTDVVDGKSFESDFSYDSRDNLLTMTYATGRKVQYAYNAENQISRVFKPETTQAYAADFSYHASGGILTYRAGNGIVTTIAYDPTRYWVTAIQAGALSVRYEDYDNVGNVGRITDSRSDRSQTFAYDELDRLLAATGAGWYGAVSFTYDAHGNALLPNLTYEPGNPFRLKTVNGAAVRYDANGNLEAGPNVSFTYVPGNRLTSVTAGTTTTEFAYDADNWRVKKIVTGGEVHYYVRGLNGALLTDWWNNGPTGQAEVRDYIYAGSRLLAVVKTIHAPK